MKTLLISLFLSLYLLSLDLNTSTAFGMLFVMFVVLIPGLFILLVQFGNQYKTSDVGIGLLIHEINLIIEFIIWIVALILLYACTKDFKYSHFNIAEYVMELLIYNTTILLFITLFKLASKIRDFYIEKD